MFTRIATASTQHLAIDSLQRRQSSLAETQKQISTGEKYDNFADMAKDGQTRRVVDFNSSLDRINNFKHNNTILASRMTSTDSALSAIQDINTKAIAAITQERSAVGPDNPLHQLLGAFLQQFEDQLNVTIDGRYLFSGAATTTKPVDDLTTSNIDATTGQPNDNYYKGDSTKLTQFISTDVSVQYNITANDPAFQKLIGAMHLAIKAEASGDDVGLSRAFDLANDAQKDITNMRSITDSKLTTIDQVNAQHSNFQTYYKNALDGLTGTDVAEASIQLSLDQAVLTASFQAFARVSSLSLGNYLK